MQIHRFSDPAAFLDGAEPFLLSSEAENSLMLSLRGLLGPDGPRFDGQCYWATVEDAGNVVACAVRTPPFGVVLTRAESAAVDCLVSDIADKYETVPAVLGPEPGVALFAQRWADRLGTLPIARMRQRLFEIRAVQPLASRPPGTLRLADAADLPLVAEWAAAFHDEARVGTPVDPRKQVHAQVARKAVFVWDEGRPVSMAGCGGRTARGGRIAFVYTPPEERGRGYASACVADLTQRLLDEGRSFCCISTDLANPTSNKIYQTIGYRPVCDVTDFDLTPGVRRVSDGE